MQLNKVFIAGNLTRDPELRYTPSGAAVCNLGLASNREYYQNQEKKKEVCFVDVTVWGKSADNCSQYLSKGSEVLIEGRLSYRSWKDGDGMRSKINIVAESVQFLSRTAARESKADIPGCDEENIPF